MRNRPPDRCGPPRRRNAGEPSNLISYPIADPKWGTCQTQEKIANALAVDPWLGVGERTLAVCTAHRVRYGLPVPPGDARELTAIYQERHNELALLLRMYA